MRIGLFSDVYEPLIGGVSTSVKMLKKALEKQGHKVYVVTPNMKRLKYDYDSKEKILRIPAMTLGIYEEIQLSTVYPAKMLKLIKSWNLDVIHMHTELSVGAFAKLFTKQHNIPLIYTYHTIYEKSLYYMTKGKFQKITKGVLKQVHQFYCKEIDEIIAPGEKVYNLLRDRYGVESKINIIPNGIDVKRFYKEKTSKNLVKAYAKDLGIKEKDFILEYIGRLSDEKSVDFLITCMPRIVKYNKNIKLLLVGDGPDREKLEKLVDKNKVKDNVIFAGRIPWESIPEYYQLGDVFVTASTFENHSMTIIEAMAASLPVLCINDLSFTCMVKEGENGKIFKNKKQYVEAAKYFYQNKEDIKVMGERARGTANNYSSEKYAERVLKLYEKAIANKGSRDLGWLSNFITKIKNIKG